MSHADKDTLRRAMLEKRAALTESFRDSAARAVEERIFSRPEWAAAPRVGLYWAVRGEMATRGIFRRLRQAGRQVYLPRLGAEGLEFAEVREESELVAGTWGILEPPARLPAVAVESLSAILAPGVAFDLRGARLGWGKGYYDRVLRDFRGRRWALAYDFQVLDENIPTDARDEPVEFIVTERRVIEGGMRPKDDPRV